jgi:hypothetical protein
VVSSVKAVVRADDIPGSWGWVKKLRVGQQVPRWVIMFIWLEWVGRDGDVGPEVEVHPR